MNLLGKIRIEPFKSRVLSDNPLRDSPIRTTPVYLPEGHERGGDFPLIVLLAGFAGSGMSHLNWSAWSETFPERLERLFAEKKLPPCVVIMPDPFTKLGGCQFVNSSAVGNYETHVTEELIPWVREHFRAGLTPDKTIIMGKSSGGYGAFCLAAKHPELFGFALVHSADCYFEYGYLPEFPATLSELQKYDSPNEMIACYGDPTKRISHAAINQTAMAACYSPNPKSPWAFDYPFDLETGEIRADVWAKWLEHDPVRMSEKPEIIANLKKLSGLYIECGKRDEFHLQWGARILSKRLRTAGVNHEYREFDGGHFNLQWRYDESLSWVGKRV